MQQQLATGAAVAEVVLDEEGMDPGDVNDTPTSSTQGSDSGNEGSDTEGDSGSEDGHDAQPGSRQQQHASFLDGEKSASFAKAFAKIMGSKSAKADGGNVILAESASLAKRKAEVATEEAAAKAAKKQRQERKQRGHAVRVMTATEGNGVTCSIHCMPGLVMAAACCLFHSHHGVCCHIPLVDPLNPTRCSDPPVKMRLALYT